MQTSIENASNIGLYIGGPGPGWGPYGPIWALMGPIWVLLDRSGHDQITTFGPISHVSGPKLIV